MLMGTFSGLIILLFCLTTPLYSLRWKLFESVGQQGQSTEAEALANNDDSCQNLAELNNGASSLERVQGSCIQFFNDENCSQTSWNFTTDSDKADLEDVYNNSISSYSICPVEVIEEDCPAGTFVWDACRWLIGEMFVLTMACGDHSWNVRSYLSTHAGFTSCSTAANQYCAKYSGMDPKYEPVIGLALTYNSSYESFKLASIQCPHQNQPSAQCGPKEAICGLRARTEISTRIVKGLQFTCCPVPHPVTAFSPRDEWKLLGECNNEDGTTLKTCTFNTVTGVATNLSDYNMRKEYGFYHAFYPAISNDQSLIDSFKEGLGSDEGVVDWNSVQGQTWLTNTIYTKSVTVSPGQFQIVFQGVGYLGYFIVNTNTFRIDGEQVPSPSTTPPAEFVCPDAFGNYFDPYSCSRYYVCSNWVAYHMQCPANLHYIGSGYCDYPQGCQDSLRMRDQSRI